MWLKIVYLIVYILKCLLNASSVPEIGNAKVNKLVFSLPSSAHLVTRFPLRPTLFVSCLGLCASWTWLIYFLSHVREVFSCYLLRYFIGSFLSSPSGTPRRQILLCLILSQRSLRLPSFLFLLFSIFCSPAVISTILSSRSFIHSSASVFLLWIPCSVLFNSIYLFFNSSWSLVNISCIPHFFSEILDHLHYHYSEFFFWEVAYLHFPSFSWDP